MQMSLKLTEKTAEIASDKNVANFTTRFDDERTRVTQWIIAPGDQTGWHLHDHDYPTLQQSTGTLHLKFADSTETTINYVPDTARMFRAPVEHNATNIRKVDIRVIEIEYKR